MRSLIIIVLIFIAQFSDAQVLNDSNATIILSKTKQDINLKIWNAVSAGRIIAYRNDSFTSTVPKDSLNSWYKVYKRREITDPDEGVFNRLGTVVFEPHDFNPNKDFTGLDFVFEPSWDVESTTYSNKLVGVAPTWKITTESGIELGNHLLFIVKLKDLEDVFSTRKLKALAMQRSTLGDFKFRYLDEYSSTEDIANSMLWNSLLGQKNILTWNLKF
ncbi:MAG: hypothetical protein KJP21_01820, partial [Bacteroidia bacterium]|nr:hypothetical protein [Bacteroidia bacterium]